MAVKSGPKMSHEAAQQTAAEITGNVLRRLEVDPTQIRIRPVKPIHGQIGPGKRTPMQFNVEIHHPDAETLKNIGEALAKELRQIGGGRFAAGNFRKPWAHEEDKGWHVVCIHPEKFDPTKASLCAGRKRIDLTIANAIRDQILLMGGKKA